ncbi:profilin-1-like [Heptranchias perlo]|uniref:profilin-1-like n=1 Tax=Heptranchias perlo TaxID=212740 RepID=UPI00355A1EFF
MAQTNAWQGYIDSLTSDNLCRDAVIIGIEGTPAIWASVPSGNFSQITPEQVKAVIGENRAPILQNGIVLGSRKYTVVRDCLHCDCFLDIKSKCIAPNDEACSATISKSNKVLVIVEARSSKEPAGCMNKRAFDMAEHLSKSGF